MPLAPTTWLSNVPVTAGQLNQDLYTYDGSYFAANGVMFHSNRPICQEIFKVQTTVSSSPNGTWTKWGGGKSQGLSVIDTSALFGIGCDSPAEGAYFRSQGVTAVGSSGVAGQRGGWVLMMAFPVIGAFSSATKAAFGAGWFIGTAPSINDVGCIQIGTTARDSCAPAVNLFNVTTAPSYYYPGSLVADANSHQFTAQGSTVSNSCGEVPRFSQVWCGVNSGGSTVASIPVPQTVFTATTPITAALMNSTVKNSLALLNYPPMLNAQQALSAAITNNTATLAPFSSAPILDSYAGFSTSSHFYTVPLNGAYFCHANIILTGALATGNCAAGFLIKKSGSTATTTFWGGNYPVTTNAVVQNGCPITRMLDLQAGDQIAAFGFQNSGSSSNFGNGYNSHFIVAWMGALAAPSTTLTWTPPDTVGQLLQAGTAPGTASGDLVPVFNSKIANDLNFLINRPYVLANQQVSQTGLTVNVFHTVVMDTLGGQVHGSGAFDGDNYGNGTTTGWISGANNRYIAPVDGWYLVTTELGITPGVAGSITAGINCPVSGGMTAPTFNSSPPDWYQHMPSVTSGGPSAPLACGLYYLQSGEFVQPQVMFQPNSGTVATSTDVTNFSSSFSAIWMSE